MWKHNFDSLAGAVTQTLGSLAKAKYNSADFKLTTQLLNNAGVFAAFKNHNEQNQLVKLLVDGDGKPRSFADFKTAAAPIVEQYNKTWLKTEHNQATSNATMAKKWIDFERTRSLYPNLEYRAVGDSHTRPSHAKLDGIIRPIDDPFWDSCYPPNGWGCRCDVVKTDKPATQNQNVPEITPDNGFDNNPGKDGKLFSDSAGYYDVPDEKRQEIEVDGLNNVWRQMERRAIETLRGKTVKAGEFELNINRKGIEKTRNINDGNWTSFALSLLQNENNLSLLLKSGKHHTEKFLKKNPAKMTANKGISQFHVWTGKLWDNADWVIKAKEDNRGNLFFYYLQIK